MKIKEYSPGKQKWYLLKHLKGNSKYIIIEQLFVGNKHELSSQIQHLVSDMVEEGLIDIKGGRHLHLIDHEGVTSKEYIYESSLEARITQKGREALKSHQQRWVKFLAIPLIVLALLSIWIACSKS